MRSIGNPKHVQPRKCGKVCRNEAVSTARKRRRARTRTPRAHLEISVAQEDFGAARLSRHGRGMKLHALLASFTVRDWFPWPFPRLLKELYCSLVRRPPAQAVFILRQGRRRGGGGITNLDYL